ncbi:uncharacterized protein LOC136094513 [Hydra vulgaris]|uniref:uncharacterized protein LOC136094513 n=1 Tax=Hydra vulgaris TaxID=6087 RepID=UPI0032EA8B9A
MTYLRNLVHGQAYSAINGLSLSNENHTIALDISKQRFSNKQLTVSFYMKKLDRLNNIKNVNSLRKLLDTVEIQIRSLENIGIDSSMYGSLLVSIMLEKLPEELNLIISRKLNEDETWDIKDVFNILKAELRAREHISSSDLNTLPFTASTFHSSNNSSNKYDKRNLNYKRNDTHSPVCVFCEIHTRVIYNNISPVCDILLYITRVNNHKSHQCKLVTNITARKKIISDKKCRFRCLSNKHFSNKCSSKLKCFKCNRYHHVSICDSDNRDKYNNNMRDNNKDGELTSVASTSFLSASKSVIQSTETVLLQTALATVKSQDHARFATRRILFDNYSQLSYITPETCVKLKLKHIDSKEINNKTFGQGSISEVLDKVRVSIKNIYGYFINFECFVKDICSPLSGQHFNIAWNSYKHLKGFRLANYNNSKENLSVDILIGANFYWKFMENSIIRGVNGPVAISLS